MKAIVIINESHSLMEDQERVLSKKFGDDWDIYPVPSSGWTKEEMDLEIEKILSLRDKNKKLSVVFASPIPYMLMQLTRNEVYAPSGEFCESTGLFIHVLHNDNRDKKELPNGKYISVVAKEGWQLL